MVLKAAFGLRSFNYHEPDGAALNRGARNAQTAAYLEQYRIEEAWERFYDRVGASAALALIKTHHLPRDSHPCIHIVRDGRSCLASFAKYIQDYYPGGTSGLEELIKGKHTVGSWQEHYWAWKSRPDARRLVLRYEEILEGSDKLLQDLAHFLELAPPKKKWAEVQSEIHSACPDFDEGRLPQWRPPAYWKEEHTLLFRNFHGKAMEDLGYGF
jgi:hypothetical protein